MNHIYVVGQRWLNHADPDLGLGIITAIELRRLEVTFPAIEDQRIYALDCAPLTRITYNIGDEITTIDQRQLKITYVQETDGIFHYDCVDAAGIESNLPETQLSATIKFSSPLERFFAGDLGKHREYKLKIKTLNLLSELYQSDSHGLIGARTEHIPHQVYIASEVANRYAPRVLLSDEVGLGKTIEAGLIMHHQMVTERAKRVLIIVPQSLVHQWFVEMLRRFNMTFSIFDESRCQSIIDENPFETEQLIITSLEFLLDDPHSAALAQVVNWDLITVDEAHHLYNPSQSSNPAYQCIENFASINKGLLLLTATPEQYGQESQFALLRLLDNARFEDYERFQQQQTEYHKINGLVEQLLKNEMITDSKLLPNELQQDLHHYLGSVLPDSISDVIKALIDQHGTGRVLFRNARTVIKGFPQRVVNTCYLEKPSIYNDIETDDITELLQPETFLSGNAWLDEDPRVEWLIEKVAANYPKKVLVIAAHASTAIALEKYLRLNTSIRAVAFHERLSIIERDKAAAYFSDIEDGADCLICSEIGSEGRNFQFSSDLILFDLPFNPDLLEQRIGRLDRIGQQHDVTIHLPIIQDMPGEIWFKWLHEGLNAFEKNSSFSFAIFQQFEAQILSTLQAPTAEQCQKLIEQTKQTVLVKRQQVETGRDRLLEISSCNNQVANALIQKIEQEETPETLQNYMADVFNVYGIEHELHSSFTEIINTSDHMKQHFFPGLKEEEKLTVTYSREKALVREDIEFLSFEHPMVRDVMDMILTDSSSTAVFCSMAIPNLPPAALLLEAYFSPKAIAPSALALHRYLPFTPIRVLASEQGKDLNKVVSHQQLSQLCKIMKRHYAHELINHVRQSIEPMTQYAEQFANQALLDIQQTATAKVENEIGLEIDRLTNLKKINPSVKQCEIDFLEHQLEIIKQAIKNTSLQLEGIRVVINNS